MAQMLTMKKPSNLKRKRKHGFRSRMKKKKAVNLLSQEEGRKAVNVSPFNDQRFSKQERLRKQKEFERVFRQGNKLTGKLVALHYIYNGEDLQRVGVTVSKRVDKKAVTRNRLKRIFREIFRIEKAALPKGVDIILRALPACSKVEYGELRYEILSLAENIRPEKTNISANKVL